MKKLFIILALLAWLPITHASDKILNEATDAYLSLDYEKAFLLFKPLAEQGNKEAQYFVGSMYKNNQAVPQDYAEALKWLKQSGEKGYAAAQFSLGLMYSQGLGTPKNDNEAAKWYRKSALQGVGESQNNLAIMYYGGTGVSQNFIKSYMWARIAAANNIESAQEFSEYLEKVMSGSDIDKASRLAKRCWESNYKYCGE